MLDRWFRTVWGLKREVAGDGAVARPAQDGADDIVFAGGQQVEAASRAGRRLGPQVFQQRPHLVAREPVLPAVDGVDALAHQRSVGVARQEAAGAMGDQDGWRRNRRQAGTRTTARVSGETCSSGSSSPSAPAGARCRSTRTTSTACALTRRTASAASDASTHATPGTSVSASDRRALTPLRPSASRHGDHREVSVIGLGPMSGLRQIIDLGPALNQCPGGGTVGGIEFRPSTGRGDPSVHTAARV